jgi:hypothetical protein
MSPSRQLTLIPRCLKPQESSFKTFCGLDHDTGWPDAALPTRGWIVLYSALPLDLKEHEEAM